MALVIGGAAGCEPPADASFIGPALTWTVLTLTGFIGSAEPGIADIAWDWMTPLVNGAGSGLACGSNLFCSALAAGGGRAAAAAAISDGFAGAIERVTGMAASPGSAAARVLAD